MMPNISHVRRNILLLLGGAIISSIAILGLITPSIIRYSPQAVQSTRTNLCIFAPILAVLMLTTVHVYFKPVSQLGRYLRQGESPPPELAQQARTRSFSAPFYLFFTPLGLVGLTAILFNLYGLVTQPGYDIALHFSYSLLIIVTSAAFALTMSTLSRRILRPVLLVTADLAQDVGRRYEIRLRLEVMLLSLNFITLYVMGMLAFNQVYTVVREEQAANFRQWGHSISHVSPYLDEESLLDLITNAYILQEYPVNLALSDPDGHYRLPPSDDWNFQLPIEPDVLAEKDGHFALTVPIERDDGVWNLNVTYTYDPAKAPVVRRSISIMSVFGITILSLTLISAYYLADDITRDLKLITTRLQDIARRGHVGERVYQMSLDEVGDLIAALDQVQKVMARQKDELDRRMNQVRQLHQASLALTSSVEFEHIINRICQVTQDITASDNVTLYLYEVESDTFTLASQVGQEDLSSPAHYMRPQGMTRAVFDERLPILVADTLDNPQVNPEIIKRGIRSIIVVPIVSRTQSMGVLYVKSLRPNAYDDQDLQVVTLLAGQAAAAIENASLLNETMTSALNLERRARNLAMINRISRDLTALLNPYAIFKATAKHLVELMDIDHCGILLFDENAEEGTVVAEYPDIGAVGRRLPRKNNPAIEHVLATRQPLAVSDINLDPMMDPVREQLAEVGIRAILIAPLVARDQIIGTIGLDVLHRTHEFSSEDQELCRTIAAQAAIAASTARLLYDLQQQRRALTRKSQELAEESSKLDTILTSVPDGLVVSDLAGRIMLSNPSFKLMAGRSINQPLRGRLLDEVFSLAALRGAIADTLVHPEQSTSIDLEMPDGRVLQASAAVLRMKQISDPTLPSQVKGVVTVLRDITHKVEVDRMKTDFISTISHELRTPLTSILGFSSLIQREFQRRIAPLVKNDARANRATHRILGNLGIIEAESQRLTRLINDLLDIAKMESGRTEWNMTQIDMAQVIHSSINATAALAVEQNLSVKTDLPSALPLAWGDSDRMTQVLTNLLSNAIKFTPQGSVTVSSWELNANSSPPPQAPEELQTPALVVSVSDTGIGVAEKDLPLVFERFRQVGDTLTEKPKGTGLGLSICKEIIEHHGGTIWLDSELGQGSTFYFTLRLSTQPGRAPKTHLPETGPLLMTSGHRAVTHQPILVVDDEPHIRQLLRQELNEVGYQVIEAGDGDAALNQARLARPGLIILDLFMPSISGFAVLGALRADPETAHIPVIVLSVAIEEASRALELGAKACLAKPVNVKKLLDSIERFVPGNMDL